MNLVDVWRRIAAWHQANTPPGIFGLAPGASRSEISQFEAAIGLALPADVRKSFPFTTEGSDTRACSRTKCFRLHRFLRDGDPILSGRGKMAGDWERTGSLWMFVAR